jgi:hypothetical protein
MERSIYMFGSSILEVAIGLVFIYLLLSLICSAVNEIISSILNKRGENLFEGIKNLLNDPTFTSFAQKLYNHGLVDGISQSAKNPNKANRHPSYMASNTFALALLDILSSHSVGESWKDIAERRKVDLNAAKAKLDTSPSDTGFQKIFNDTQAALTKAQEILTKIDAVKLAYDDAECAATKVRGPKDIGNLKIAKVKLEEALTIGRVLAAELPDPLGNIEKAVTSLPPGHTKQSLLVLINKTKRDTALVSDRIISIEYQIVKLQENIEQWFNDAMDRVGGWYKRWTQRILLGIAIFLVLTANVDTLMLVKRFSRDNALRASIVAAADKAVQNNAGNSHENASLRRDLLTEAEKLTMPLGWIPNKDDPYKTEQIPNCNPIGSSCIIGWALKLVGLLISIIAIQLGAPFWFDTLSKFINIRGAGTPPGEPVKSGPQTAMN